MSRRTSENEYRKSQLLIAAVYLLLVGILGAATAVAETPARSSVSAHTASGGRDASAAPTETVDVYAPLVTAGERTSSKDGRNSLVQSSKPNGAPPVAQAGVNDFWIYDADVILFGDDDNDGFFYRH